MTATTLRRVEPTSLEESLRRLETLVSPHTGVVRAVESTLATTDDAPLVTVSCDLADTRVSIGAAIDANAVAWSSVPDAARAAALGEAAERYSAGLVPEHELVLACADDLGGEAADPRCFALFHERQYNSLGFLAHPFTPATPVRWVRGFEIATGRRAWLPAQLVFLAGAHLVPGEELIAYPTSNGLACRPTLEEAILSGLLEVLERDAFAITWYSQLSLPRLEIAGSEFLERFHERYVAPTGLRCTTVDLSVFHRIPTVLAIVHGNRSDPVALSVGAASAPDAADAWTRAVGEAFGSRAWARYLRLAEPDRTFEASFADVTNFDDHVHLHAIRRYARSAAFLAASAERHSLTGVPELEGNSVTGRIEAILQRLGHERATAYAVDVTAPDVRAAGLTVIKTIVPELCQLDVIHGARYLGGERLSRAAWALGLRSAPLGWHELNPNPHPFP